MNRDLALWTGLLAGPIVWLISFQTLFALNPWTCIWTNKLTMYIVTIAALSISLAAALLAWRSWNQLGREVDPRGGDMLSRSRSMAFGGIMISSFSCLLIIAQSIPELILGACQ